MATNDNLRRTVVPAETTPVRSESTTFSAEAPLTEGGRHLQGTTAVPAPMAAVKRISWGAILAGVVMALVAQLAFSLLGLGLGASAFNPYDNHSAGSWGIGATLYTLLSVLISLFTGGYVAGRLAGFPHRQDSMLHGLVTFGLTTLLGFYLLTSGLGTIIGGAGSLVSSVVSAAGQGAAQAGPGLMDTAKQKLQDNGVDLSNLQGQGPKAQQTADQAQQAADQAKAKAMETADAARQGAAKAGLASSLALLLGALAAALGGRAATPRDGSGITAVGRV